MLAKPTGAICNLACRYCFYLSKDSLYPGDRFHMSDEVVVTYLEQFLEAHAGEPEVTIAWQGGEPTLMGVDFFRRALKVVDALAPARQKVNHVLQTNATLLNDEWASLLAQRRFLVGVSIDGPAHLHDRYRVDKRGGPTSAKVLAGLAHLQRHQVEWNVMCTVNAANEGHATEVYRYFRDELGAQYLQFIPIVERDPASRHEGEAVSARSVSPEGWGRFLNEIFDLWVTRDVGRVFVSHFDSALGAWLGMPSSQCVFAETCGDGVALEHNGDLYACDHFVDPEHRLGNITETHMVELLALPAQRAFGEAKRDHLSQRCVECEVRFACHGECPKNRFDDGSGSDPALNYLCAGYRSFFTHVGPVMRMMADRLDHGGLAEDVMVAFASVPRNGACPCGSGRKVKFCHGRAR